MNVAGKVAVITGASRGIGQGLARVFARSGMKLGLCARTKPEIPDGAESAVSGSVDVSNWKAVDGFATQVLKELGPIDLWINNAGLLAPIGMTREVDPDTWSQLIDVNVKGVYHGTRAALRQWSGEGHVGTIINIGSGASTGAYEGWGAYCASKAAVDHFTRVVALEEASRGHRIYALAPGVIETDMQRHIRTKSSEDFPMVERFHQMKNEGQLQNPESPAQAILRLAFGSELEVEDPCLDVRTLTLE